MRPVVTSLISLALSCSGLAAGEVARQTEAPTKAVQWIVHKGSPIAVQGTENLYLNTEDYFQHAMKNVDLAEVRCSPSGEYLVAIMHEPLLNEAQRKLSSEYIVYAADANIRYRANMAINTNEKRYQAAVSDAGMLALVDPRIRLGG